MYKRKDDLYEKIITINGVRLPPFRAKTEKEVWKKIALYKEKLKNGRLFCDVASEWSELHENNSSYNAHRAYNVPYRETVEYFADKHLSEITVQDIDIYIKRVASKGFALRTVKGYLSLLNLIFNHAIIKGDVSANPAQYVKPPKGLKTETRELPDTKTIKSISDNVSDPNGLLPYFLLYTGCRRGEALAIQLQDIDFDNNIIHITKSLYFEGNIPYIKEPKTKSGYRDVPLLDTLKTELKKRTELLKAEDYVFGDGANPPTHSMFVRRWKSYLCSAGISVTPHQLRHLFATILYEQKIDEKLAQDILGHSSIRMTKDLYTHIRKSKMDGALKKLNNYKIK
jgi:integrase